MPGSPGEMRRLTEMQCKKLPRRLRVLTRVVHAVEVNGFPFDPDIRLIIEFIDDAENGIQVRLTRQTIKGKKANKPVQWSLDEIRNRSVAGLRTFADRLGIDSPHPGATLANTIEDKAKGIPTRN